MDEEEIRQAAEKTTTNSPPMFEESAEDRETETEGPTPRAKSKKPVLTIEVDIPAPKKHRGQARNK